MERDSRRSHAQAALRVGLGATYLIVMARIGATGTAQLVLVAVALVVSLCGPAARRWWTTALPFAILAAVYDLLGLLKVPVAAGGVHIEGPYWFDKTLFGFEWQGVRLSLNELAARYHSDVIDLVTGVAYLTYLYAVIGFALFVAVRDRSELGQRRTRALGWTFLGLNLAGFATYLLFPVAPPWYVARHGFGPVDVHTPASPAALVRWDHLVGIPYFAHLYANSSDVFGAMPSLHCAYPMLLFWHARELRWSRLTAAVAAFQALMCFSAIYLQHHYLSDALAGMTFATAGYFLERLLSGRPRGESASADEFVTTALPATVALRGETGA
jgi:hypothetical protein